MSRSLAVLCVLVAVAAGAPTAPAKRVVLADADPELRRAIVASLKPWRLEVVVDPIAPSDAAGAAARADRRAARFVVWREADQLVVYDRDSGQTERRAARIGKLDAIGAAAAALTVKTMMRLPPPPADLEPELGVAQPPPTPPDDGVGLRLELGVGPRIASGLDTDVGLRFELAALVRPWRDRGWRFGALADLGSGDSSIDRAGFQGTWSEWGVLGIASWAVQLDAWEVEPWAGLGLERSSLDGMQMGAPRAERATLATARGGLFARYRFGRWSVGAVAGVEVAVGTPTYIRAGTTMPIFQVPPFGVLGAVVIGVDVAP